MERPTKARLDTLLVERGLFPSREKARRAVMAGVVEVAGRRVDRVVPEHIMRGAKYGVSRECA